jgi:hypothetical protein
MLFKEQNQVMTHPEQVVDCASGVVPQTQLQGSPFCDLSVLHPELSEKAFETPTVVWLVLGLLQKL